MVRLLVWVVAFFLAGAVGFFVLHLNSVIRMVMYPPFPAWEFKVSFLVPMLNHQLLIIAVFLLLRFWLVPFLVFRIAAEVMNWWSLRGAVLSGVVVSIIGSALITFSPANRWPSLDLIMAEFLIFGVVGFVSGAAYYLIENRLFRLGGRTALG